MALTGAEYRQALDPRIAAAVAALAERNPAFARRLAAAGLAARDVSGGRDLERLPVLTKDGLRELQLAEPPFGGLLSVGEHPRRIFQSPGPIYEPEPDEADPWRFAEALRSVGFSAADRVLNAFGYHLSPAGAMFEQACLAVGATVVPIGIGSKDLQVRAAVDVGATAYIGSPSYLKALLDTADELGLGGELALERAFMIAEPLPDSLRAQLKQRVPVVLQGYGTAEAGNIAYECRRAEGMHVSGSALVQICELGTGQIIDGAGPPGEVVVTVPRVDYPVVRFGTGDLSAWMPDACSCGSPLPRIRGWLGRIGQAVKVKGMFLHPQQVAELMSHLAGVSAYRVEVSREDHQDSLQCLVVAADGAPANLAEEVRSSFRDALRFNCDVQVVDSLPDGESFADLRAWDS